jgi:polyisoprenyl-phosphate glycosyltransferase
MISVIIPAYDEGDAIAEAVGRIRGALEGRNAELVVVDDGSSDRTGELARRAGARVIRHPHNLGYGASLKTGIAEATHDTIVITDADGTYPSESIAPLLDEFARGYDMVVGARTGPHYRESLVKSPLRVILKWLVEFTVGRSIPDVNSGLRVFSRRTVVPYFATLCNTFSFTTSLTLAYMMTGRFVGYLPIPYHARIGVTKVHLFRDSLRTLQYIVQAILYYNPLKIFLVLCALLVSGSIACLGAATLFRWLSAFYLGIGGLIVAVIVFCFGLLAELLRQILAVAERTSGAAERRSPPGPGSLQPPHD